MERSEPQNAKQVAACSATFFFFPLVVYCVVVSMARLHEGDSPTTGE